MCSSGGSMQVAFSEVSGMRVVLLSDPVVELIGYD